MQDEYTENTSCGSPSDIKCRIQEVRARLEQLADEQKQLERELHELHLAQERIIAVQRFSPRISDTFPPEKKIRIFRSLFRGRADVFPRRFESIKTGKCWTIFLFSRKILSTSKWRIFRVSKGGAFSLLEKFSGRNWNFILPQKRV